MTPPKMGVIERGAGYVKGVRMTMGRARWAPGAAVAVLLAGLAGCSSGGRGNPTGPVRVVETFEAALTSGDAETACGLLAPPTRQELEQSESERCAKALPQQEVPAATSAAADVDVFGDEAIARVAGDVLFLTNVGGTWMVSAAGCKPQPDQPYDCEVKGS